MLVPTSMTLTVLWRSRPQDDRSQCAQNGLYHGDPFAARWQNYRIARTISTMKSKCETLVMALSELIWWGFVP